MRYEGKDVNNEKTLGGPLSCADVGQEGRQLQVFKLQPSGLSPGVPHYRNLTQLVALHLHGRGEGV